MKIELLGRHAITVTFDLPNVDEVIRKQLLLDLLIQNRITHYEKDNMITLADFNNNLELLRCFQAFYMPIESEKNLSGYCIYLKHTLQSLKIPYNPSAAELMALCKDKRKQSLLSEEHPPVEPYYFLEPTAVAELTKALQTDQERFKGLQIKRRFALCIPVNHDHIMVLLKIDQVSFAAAATTTARLSLLTTCELSRADQDAILAAIQTVYKVTIPPVEITLINLKYYIKDTAQLWALCTNVVCEWLMKDILFFPVDRDQKIDGPMINLMEAMYNFSKKTPMANFETRSADAPATPVIPKKGEYVELTEFDKLLKKDEPLCAVSCGVCNVM
jgi:hypothetical protein